MTEILETLHNLMGLVLVLGTIASMGLSLTMKEITGPLRNACFVIVALVANFIVPPVAALLLIRIFSLDEPLAVGLMLVSLAAGKVKIEVETTYVEQKAAGPLKVTLKANGKLLAEGVVPVSAPVGFTANDCLDIGQALGSPVSMDYRAKAPFKFNGTIEKVHVKYL